MEQRINMNDERIPAKFEMPKKLTPEISETTGLGEPVPTKNVRDTHEEDGLRAELSGTHAVNDRTFHDGRELSDVEFMRSLEFDGGINNILPQPPKIEGYHTMWASTMNEQDLRMRLDVLGYTFVKLEECPHYHNHTPRSAKIEGVVSYNELVAVKIKKGREQLLAKKFHHDAPLNSERAIKKKLAEMMDYEGKRIGITMDQGTESLGQAPPKPPTFSV